MKLGLHTKTLVGIAAGISILMLPMMSLATGNGGVISASRSKADSAPWTEERMDAAEPMPLPMLPADVSKGGTSPWVYTSYDILPDVTLLYKQPLYRTVGKLFFHNPYDGFDYVCSGAVVNAQNRDTVWTAGHCVYSPGLGFHVDFVFVPARHNGTNPYGSWSYRSVWTLVAWQNGLHEYDMGALVMDLGGPGGTHHVQELGGLNFIANLPRDQHFHARGYPAAPPFTGEKHHTCAASWVTNDQPDGIPGVDPETIGIGCDMTGGSSGGAWVVDWGTNNYLNSNVSYGYMGTDYYFGPYFGDAAQALYDAASVD
ncbi:MAG: hypothetical protein U9Q81_04770 [Pseudomonadota bacterium]|nr:hypothetical protein [Pseudomonadota bacterium]